MRPLGWPGYDVFQDEHWPVLLGLDPRSGQDSAVMIEAVLPRDVAKYTNRLIVEADRLRLADRHAARAVETVPMYIQAAAAGDCRGMHRLGSMYLTGEWRPACPGCAERQPTALEVGAAVSCTVGRASILGTLCLRQRVHTRR